MGVSGAKKAGEFEVPDFLARDFLRGVLGQRLVVVSCPACGGAGCGACGGSGAMGRRVEAELWRGKYWGID